MPGFYALAVTLACSIECLSHLFAAYCLALGTVSAVAPLTQASHLLRCVRANPAIDRSGGLRYTKPVADDSGEIGPALFEEFLKFFKRIRDVP